MKRGNLGRALCVDFRELVLNRILYDDIKCRHQLINIAYTKHTMTPTINLAKAVQKHKLHDDFLRSLALLLRVPVGQKLHLCRKRSS